MWLAAWTDAKRTVAPPNAKHSTLLQGCFLCFCFWPHSRFGNNADSIPRTFSTEPKKISENAIAFSLIFFGSVEKVLGIESALLPNREWGQKQKHKKQP